MSLSSPSTPHARGSTLGQAALDDVGDVYPACAGIHPEPPMYPTVLEGLPRMRGDPPLPGFFAMMPFKSTPHARGSTL